MDFLTVASKHVFSHDKKHLQYSTKVLKITFCILLDFLAFKVIQIFYVPLHN